MESDRRTKSRSIETLKTRADFQRVRGGGRASTPAFVLEGKPRPQNTSPRESAPSCEGGQTAGANKASVSPFDAPRGPRFGFTITKKIGNAVVRNRIRRRFRAALSELADLSARPGTDYVLVAREPAFALPFATLLADLKSAFDRVHSARSKPSPNTSTQPSPHTSGPGKDRQGVTEGSSRPPARSATSTHPSKSSRD